MIHPTPIDITNMPDLVRIAEEVEATKKSRELRRASKTLAVLMPTGATVQRGSYLHKRTIWTGYDSQRVRAALKQSAGGLQGVDREELLIGKFMVIAIAKCKSSSAVCMERDGVNPVPIADVDACEHLVWSKGNVGKFACTFGFLVQCVVLWRLFPRTW